MNVLILSGSPKKRFSASAFFAGVLQTMLAGCRFTKRTLGSKNNYGEIFEYMKIADAVVITSPIYVDGIPSHVLDFLREAERFCRENACSFNMYVISNSGFIEGKQNRPHLEQYRCWCERAGITWGGGMGIGGGVMLHVLFYVLLVNIALFAVKVIFNLVSGAMPVSVTELLPLGRSALSWLFFNSGMLLFMGMLAYSIRKRACMKNKYTRAMVPSFLFLIFADIFMLISALFKGKLIFSLYKRDE